MLPCLLTLFAVPPVDAPPFQVEHTPESLPAIPTMGTAVAIRRRYTFVAPRTYWPLVHIVPPASTTPVMVVPDREILARAWRLRNRRTPRPIEVQEFALAENGHGPAFSTSIANTSTKGGPSQPHVFVSGAPDDDGGASDDVVTLDHVSAADPFALSWSRPADDGIGLDPAEALPRRNQSSLPAVGGDSSTANASVVARIPLDWTCSVDVETALARVALPSFNYSSPTALSGLDAHRPKLTTMSLVKHGLFLALAVVIAATGLAAMGCSATVPIFSVEANPRCVGQAKNVDPDVPGPPSCVPTPTASPRSSFMTAPRPCCPWRLLARSFLTLTSPPQKRRRRLTSRTLSLPSPTACS